MNWSNNNIPELTRHRKQFFVSWIRGIHQIFATTDTFNTLKLTPSTSYLIETGNETAYYIPVEEIYDKDIVNAIPENIKSIYIKYAEWEKTIVEQRYADIGLQDRYKGYLYDREMGSLFTITVKNLFKNEGINSVDFEKMEIISTDSLPILCSYVGRKNTCNQLYNKYIPISIPCIIKNKSDNSYNLVGLHTLGVNVEKETDYSIVYSKAVKFLTNLKMLHYYLRSASNSLSEHYAIMNIINIHGTKAAVSAIMSRNMSHNIGSHVLSYWGNKLSKEPPDKNDLKPSKDLFNYLKQRMDFIAEITTTTPAWEKTLSLKKDIIEDYTNQFALLDNIARSEGFCYFSEKGEHLKCKKTGGEYGWTACTNNGDYCPRLPQDLRKDLQNKEPLPMKITYKPSVDVPVSIPHGVVGKQAFYSILENFIRNSAKHGGSCIRGKIQNNTATALEFTIDAEDDVKYSDYTKITISDNIGNCCAFINKGKRVIDLLNDAINDDEYIKSEDGRIKKGSWGIKEMKVSANFLRKKEVDILVSGHENDKNEPPLMQLTCYSKCETTKSCTGIENQNISLTFFLRKPKEVCIVTNSEDIKSNSKHGIDVFSYEEFKNVLNKEAIPHRFLVLDQPDESISFLTDSNRKQLPCRVVVSESGNSKDTKNNKWLTPAYLKLNFEGTDKAPETFLLNLYETFVSDKIEGSPTILMRNIKITNGGNWAENGICITEEPTGKDILKTMIVFDNHHGMIKKDEETGSPIIPESLYYQGISGSTSFGKTLENVPIEDKKKLFFKELIEAALIKVLIADERIWKNSQDKLITPNGIPVERIELLKKMGIYLVPIDGNIISETERNKVLNGEYADIVFFIIHKGLVEKMNEVKEEKIGTKFVEDVVKNIPFVMIDSGRGEPEYLEPGTRYVPMSAIESFLEEMDKYSLIQTLFSVRRFENAR